MDPLDIARWQFGITTVYHFLMVPLTIGLGLLVATLQTAYYRTKKEEYRRATKFWGKLFLVNFAMGVVTGIVQEFQFGLAWSEYSRFMGNIFGAPLALEALIAFFAESTFLGVWIFGEGRVKNSIHLASIWLATGASAISAYFIIVANSWMQHPVGAEVVIGPDGKPRADMTDVVAVLTNPTALAAFAHTIMGALITGGVFLVGISWFHMWRRSRQALPDTDVDHQVWRKSMKLGSWVAIVAMVGLFLTGDTLGKLMFQQQPMKMASAEALCDTGTDFSVLAVGDVRKPDCQSVKSITLPGLLSFLAKGDFSTPVPGINQLTKGGEAVEQTYGQRVVLAGATDWEKQHNPEGNNYPSADDPTPVRQNGKIVHRLDGSVITQGQINADLLRSYAGKPITWTPNLPVTYWGFRFMIGFGALGALLGLVGLFLSRKGRAFPKQRWLMVLATLGIATPFVANSAGWIFTEMGRQPFIVAPNPAGPANLSFFTAAAVSHIGGGEVLFSLITLTAVYGFLGVIEAIIIVKFVRAGIPGSTEELPTDTSGRTESDPGDFDAKKEEDSDVLGFAY